MAKVLSVRVDDDLAAWAEGYAAKRGVRRAQVLEGALREFRDLCRSGVPDLPEPRGAGRPKAVDPAAAVELVKEQADAPRRARRPTSPVTQERYEARMRERDRILAEARASVGRRGS